MTLKDDLSLDIDENQATNKNFANISEGFNEAQAVLSSLGYTEHEINLGLEVAERKVKNQNDTQEILQTALAAISEG